MVGSVRNNQLHNSKKVCLKDILKGICCKKQVGAQRRYTYSLEGAIMKFWSFGASFCTDIEL